MVEHTMFTRCYSMVQNVLLFVAVSAPANNGTRLNCSEEKKKKCNKKIETKDKLLVCRLTGLSSRRRFLSSFNDFGLLFAVCECGIQHATH